MKKEHIPVPKPGSRFNRYECDACNEQQVIYSHATTTIMCKHCGNKIAEPTGSRAKINGKNLDIP